MATASNTACLLLGSLAIAALGCEADSYPDHDGDPTQEDIAGEEGIASPEEDGDIAEAVQPIILPDQSIIQGTNGKCMKAASKTKVRMVKKGCRPDLVLERPEKIPTRLAWIVEASGRIRSAAYGNRCLTLPTSMGGVMLLDECSPLLADLQIFPIVPSAGSWGKICSKVLTPPGVRFCATHDGGSRVSTTFQSVAPQWYREDA